MGFSPAEEKKKRNNLGRGKSDLLCTVLLIAYRKLEGHSGPFSLEREKS